MRAAWNRIFKKGFPVLLALLLGWTMLKSLSVWDTLGNKPALSYLDTWVAGCDGMNTEQLEAYLAQISQEISQLPERNEQRFAMESDYSKLTSSYLYRMDMLRLTAFAQKKTGSLPIVLPANYLEVLDFYAALKAPQVINNGTVTDYLELQSFNTVPILVFMLSAVFWGQHYESDIFKFTGTVKNGNAYCRSIRGFLTALSAGALVINEVLDLALSGFFRSGYLWQSHILSYNLFYDTQLDMTFGQLLAVLFLCKLLNVLIMYHAGEWIAKWKKNLKDTLVYGIMLLLSLIVLTEILGPSDFFPLIQVGLVNWEDVIRKATIILPLGITALPLGFVLNLLLEAAMVGMHIYQNRRR